MTLRSRMGDARDGSELVFDVGRCRLDQRPLQMLGVFVRGQDPIDDFSPAVQAVQPARVANIGGFECIRKNV